MLLQSPVTVFLNLYEYSPPLCLAWICFSVILGCMIFHPTTFLRYIVIASETPTLYYKQPSSTFHDEIIRQCPSLLQYKPSWYLSNGHLQTLVCALRQDKSIDVSYTRQNFSLPDGGYVALDYASDNFSPNTPTILVLHGLSGGSSEYYIKTAVSALQQQSDFQVVVMNARGCGGSTLATPQAYSAAHTADLAAVISHLRSKLSGDETPLIAVGFSLGANILVKYCGEPKSNHHPPLTAAISIGNPFDLMETSRHMTRKAIHRHVYDPILVRGLKMAAESHARVFDNHPEVDMKEVRASRGVMEFDAAMTCKVFGYVTPRAYYRDGSSDDYVRHVNIPLLCLNALDDPICAPTTIPFDDVVANENVILATTNSGGHLGFFQGLLHSERWCDKVMVEYCKAIVNTTTAITTEKKDVAVVLNRQPESEVDSMSEKEFEEDFSWSVPVNHNDDKISITNEETSTVINEESSTIINDISVAAMIDGEEEEEEEIWKDPSTYLALGTVALLSYSQIRKTFRI